MNPTPKKNPGDCPPGFFQLPCRTGQSLLESALWLVKGSRLAATRR